MFNMRRFIDRFLSTEYSILLYSFIVSTIFLLIRTKSSPLYPFNDWNDLNSFFTVGKAMFNGIVPYRDLFEQKGPILYFLYGLAYLISNKTLLGGYILEVIFFTVFLYYSYKIIFLLTNRSNTIQLPIVALLVLSSKSFVHGGSAEELYLPLFSISLYYLIYYLTNLDSQTVNTNKIVLINGIIAGSILWIKFSLLGFWFA